MAGGASKTVPFSPWLADLRPMSHVSCGLVKLSRLFPALFCTDGIRLDGFGECSRLLPRMTDLAHHANRSSVKVTINNNDAGSQSGNHGQKNHVACATPAPNWCSETAPALASSRSCTIEIRSRALRMQKGQSSSEGEKWSYLNRCR